MKKLLIILLIMVVVIVGFKTDVFLYAKRLFQAEPTTHLIQEGEYLSMIAQKYYGNADYWRELALINRAPNSDAVFQGEEIVIPSLDVIKKIRRTRWLSRVNGLVKNQEDIIAGRLQEQQEKLATAAPDTKPTPEPAPVVKESDEDFVLDNNSEPILKSSMLYVVLGAVAVLLLSTIIGYIIYRRKKNEDELSLLDDIDLSNDESESEPNYQDYLRNKNNQQSEVMIR